MIFCLFDRKSRVIVLTQSLIERLFSSNNMTPSRCFFVCSLNYSATPMMTHGAEFLLNDFFRKKF